MSDSEVFEQIGVILRDRLRVTRQAEWQHELVRDLQLDSVQQLGLIVELENHFEVCFDAADEQGIVTMRDLVERIVSRRNRIVAASNPSEPQQGAPGSAADAALEKLG
ncbi:MAG: acyl carrier protein [Proteobacteria bacterium]|nr:acyl carrier protein [Pseudomonadota bacterium]